MKKTIILLALIISSKILLCQSIITEPFDKIQWDSSSTYRYDLVLRSTIFSELVYKKNEKELIDLLGEPFKKEFRTKSAIRLEEGWTTVDKVLDLTYCLDIDPNKDLNNHCIGSNIIIHLFKETAVDITIVNVD